MIAGFDRRLQQFFLDVVDEEPKDEGEHVLYASLHEPCLDWTNVQTLAARLHELGLQVPGTLLPELRADAASVV